MIKKTEVNANISFNEDEMVLLSKSIVLFMFKYLKILNHVIASVNPK